MLQCYIIGWFLSCSISFYFSKMRYQDTGPMIETNYCIKILPSNPSMLFYEKLRVLLQQARFLKDYFGVIYMLAFLDNFILALMHNLVYFTMLLHNNYIVLNE